jgi:Nbl1 / Borealin N terminal
MPRRRRKRTKTKSSRIKAVELVEITIEDSAPRRQVKSRGKRKTSERKSVARRSDVFLKATLEEFDLEVSSRCAEMRTRCEQLISSLNGQMQIELIKIPPSIRQMPLHDFVTKHNGDLDAVLRSFAQQRMQAFTDRSRALGGALTAAHQQLTRHSNGQEKFSLSSTRLGRSSFTGSGRLSLIGSGRPSFTGSARASLIGSGRASLSLQQDDALSSPRQSGNTLEAMQQLFGTLSAVSSQARGQQDKELQAMLTALQSQTATLLNQF